MFKHGVVAAALALASWQAGAATYAYASGPYSGFGNFTAPCGMGSCANFPPGTQQQGTFATAGALAPNLAAADITAQVTAYSFQDGLTTYTHTDAQSRLYFVRVSTNASGQLTGFQLVVQRWQTPGVHAAGDRFDTFDVGAGGGTSMHNVGCAGVGVSSGGTADACNNPAPDASHSNAFHLSAALPVALAAAVSAVPALGGISLLLTALALAASGLLVTRRR